MKRNKAPPRRRYSSSRAPDWPSATSASNRASSPESSPSNDTDPPTVPPGNRITVRVWARGCTGCWIRNGISSVLPRYPSQPGNRMQPSRNFRCSGEIPRPHRSGARLHPEPCRAGPCRAFSGDCEPWRAVLAFQETSRVGSLLKRAEESSDPVGGPMVAGYSTGPWEPSPVRWTPHPMRRSTLGSASGRSSAISPGPADRPHSR